MGNPLITSRDPKGQQIMSLVEAVINKAGLDDEAAQRVVEGGNELQDAVRKVIAKLATPNKFAREEVKSSYGYLSWYKPRSVADQFATLTSLFPQLTSYDEAAAKKELPAGAEGMFLIPRWQELAPTYNEALEIVLTKLSEQRGGRFVNYRVGQLGPDRLREGKKKADAMKAIGSAQNGHNVLVVPAQFGLRHRGRSVRRALAVMNSVEFGLGAFEIGIMLLTHPDRLQDFNDLWIDCAGDEYRFVSSGQFLYAPYFGFFGGELKFRARDVGSPYENYGAASAFVPASSPE